MENSPFTSVAAPKLVPTTRTLAPTRGSPVSASVTRPETEPCCAMRNEDIPAISRKFVTNLGMLNLFIKPPKVNC